MGTTSKRTKSAEARLTPGDALDILSSALRYCESAGLDYWLANGTQGEGLLIRLPDALVTEDGSRLVPMSSES